MLTEREVIELQGKKTLIGALKGVSFEDFQALQRTASKIERIEKEKSNALDRSEYAEQRVKDIELKAMAEIKKAQQEKPSMKAKMEIIELRKEN